MSSLTPWLGNLFEISNLDESAIWFICTIVAALCGAIIGFERERAAKPAGLRTVTLICVGAAIFTLLSRAMATGAMSDPARISAQIVAGIGFLGAGAIIRHEGTIVGLTTGATIWAVAAVGMAIGSGHVARGIGFTVVVFLTLTVVDRFDWLAIGRCRFRRATISYRSDNGKTRILLQEIFDSHRVPDLAMQDLEAEDGIERLAVNVCYVHREHRRALAHVAELPMVVGIELAPTP